MSSYLLDDYHLTTKEIIRSAFWSEYAVRHFVKANECSASEDRFIHRLIGLVESIPIVGAVASAIEGAYATWISNREPGELVKVVTKGGISLKSQKTIPNIKIFHQNDKREVPFYSKFQLYHGCLNETNLPNFQNYAQGIFRISKNYLNLNNLALDDSNIAITFLYKGKPFHFYCERIENQENFDIFLQNVPYNEEISIQFGVINKSGQSKKIKTVTILPKHLWGEYRFKSINNIDRIESSDLVEPTTIQPGLQIKEPKAYHLVRDIQLPLYLSAKATGGLDVHPDYTPVSEQDHILIENLSGFPIVLTFDLVPVSNRYLMEKAISYPLVIFPGDKKRLSKGFFSDIWHTCYALATDEKNISDPHVLDILYIQLDSFGNPFA